MDIAQQLQAHPLFATFSPEEMAEVVRAGTVVSYHPQDVCIRQGEAGEVFGVLCSGKLEAVRVDDETQREQLGTIEPGECFGEMSLLTGNPTGAEVVALEESEAVVFLQGAISPLIALNREAVQFLTKLMASRLAPSGGRAAAPAPAAVHYSLGATRPMRVLSVSTRRNELRYSYFDTTSDQAQGFGEISGLQSSEGLHAYHGPKGVRQTKLPSPTHEAALAAVFETLTSGDKLLGSVADLSVIGHRVCHGGLRFNGPVIVNDEVAEEIRSLAPLAPMENPYNLMGIEICQKLADGVPQVAVFDTAFHLKLPPAAHRYALPKDLAADPLLRRFGSHGISHQGAARAACAFLGMNFNALKIISVHLGSGASVTAIDHGRPVDNTMGFTPMAGLVMSTRPGDLDPGLLLYLITQRGISPEELTERLYNESGLLGLSGISDDVLTVLQAANSGNDNALLAIHIYCHSAQKHLSACIGTLGAVDAIIFTGGVGQNTPGIRARICQN
ncbi:MAG: acetate/propionate family kinase, partial [Planctomycetota bacterium]